MKDRKIILFLTIGFLFLITGFLVGKYIDTQSITEKSIMSSNPTFVTRIQNKKSSVIATTEVRVTKVFDGDTVKTETGEKIRYIGINSPEKGEPFSSDATELNKQLVLGKSIGIEYDIQKKDRFGRTLAYVFSDNNLVNIVLVKKGLVVSETIQPNVKYQDKIVDGQKEARDNCLGIWANLCKEEKPETLDERPSCIKIASIHADAAGNDNQNKNGEWVEIKNACSLPISLNGWLLKDNSASNKYQFKNFNLDANKNVLLYSGCNQDSNEKLYWQCPEGKYAIWNNSGDHAFLYNEKGELTADYQY
jgi:micrococcal nuclease